MFILHNSFNPRDLVLGYFFGCKLKERRNLEFCCTRSSFLFFSSVMELVLPNLLRVSSCLTWCLLSVKVLYSLFDSC